MRRGIIPAYAGNTACITLPSISARDHPRLRGEHPGGAARTILTLGSSPLTRGTLVIMHDLRADSGIIPAYAGNTNSSSTGRIHCRDHPRLRGEHYLRRYNTELDEGSSPLTRGTLHCASYAWTWGGIIPAYAGNTPRRSHGRRWSGDHPRLRGEHSYLPASLSDDMHQLIYFS